MNASDASGLVLPTANHETSQPTANHETSQIATPGPRPSSTPPRIAVPGQPEESEDAHLEIRRIVRLTGRDLRVLFERAVADWYRHNVPRLGAALAFYSVLSMAPLLVIVVAVAGLAFGREAAEGQLVWQIRDLVGEDGALVIQNLLREAARPQVGGMAAAFGLLTFFYGATGVFASLRDSLNTIWEAPQPPIRLGLRSVAGLMVDRTLSFAVVLGIGFLIVVSLTVNAALSATGKYFGPMLPLPEWALQVMYSLVSFLVIAVLFAVLYKFLPEIRPSWGDVALGAVVTSMLFTVGRLLIGMYLGKASVASPYGAAGSLVLVLLWIYYSAQIFFWGAEFVQVYANCYGSQPRRRKARELALRTVAGELSELHAKRC